MCFKMCHLIRHLNLSQRLQFYMLYKILSVLILNLMVFQLTSLTQNTMINNLIKKCYLMKLIF